MKHSTIKMQKGIGLIEVLITTVVISVGLLAVASLQGQFIGESGENKARAEALVLAQGKLEDLKNNVTKAGFDTLVVGSYSEPINGTNAAFTRIWTITEMPPIKTGNPSRRNISVQVGWDANGDGEISGTDELVNVVTEMAWVDPAKATQYAASNAGGGTSSVASPRQNASEDVASEQVIGTNLAITDLDLTTIGTAGVDASVGVTIPGGGTVTIHQIASDSHFYAATHTDLSTIAEGVIAIFLCSDADNNASTPDTCSHIQNHFGGVPHRISGTVHTTSSNGFNNIKVAWTSSSVNDCYNGPITEVVTSGSNQYRYRPYECVYAGNCDATDPNVGGCDYGVSDSQIYDRNVGPGGEYGDVGLLGVDDQGGNREQVCFLEDTTDPSTSPLLDTSGGNVLNETYLYSVTKRYYSTRKVKRSADNTINDQKSEGINRSYTNHNFLVVPRGSGATANQVCNLKATEKNIVLAPREIFRVLNENVSNRSMTESAYAGAAGTAKIFTGAVSSSYTNLKLIIPDEGSCYLNNNAGGSLSAYACAVANGTVSIDIYGVSDEHPSLNPSVFASCTKSDATTCNWLDNFAAVSMASDDCTAPWGATVTNGTSVTAYLNETEPYGNVATAPYTCQDHEQRTCSTGSLTGTYTHETCSISSSADCTAPWGASVTNGTSVTAYDVASVPSGYTCDSSAHTRTCTNGILDGTGNYQSCTAQTTRDILVSVNTSGTGTVSGIVISGSGASCTDTTCTVANDWTGTLSASGSCSGSPSTVDGTTNVTLTTATSATISLASCAGPVCPLPWDASSNIDSGASVLAYSASSVAYPTTCSSESRFCIDGVLSGTYSNQSCTQVCTVPTITGMATNNASNRAAVNNAILGAGFSVGSSTDTGSGPRSVSTQSPSAGSTPACGTAINYSYN